MQFTGYNNIILVDFCSPAHFKDMGGWCAQYCTGEHKLISSVFEVNATAMFVSLEDAALFKLTWA